MKAKEKWRYSAMDASAIDGGEWSSSRPWRFIPRVRASDTHWTGGWVGPRVPQ